MEFTFADYRNPVDDINFVRNLVDRVPEPREEKHNRARDLTKRYETLIKRHEKLYNILNETLDSSLVLFDRSRFRRVKKLIDKTEKEMHYNNLEAIFLSAYLTRVEGC